MFLGKKNSNASPEEIEVSCRKSVLIQIVIFSEKRNIKKNFSLSLSIQCHELISLPGYLSVWYESSHWIQELLGMWKDSLEDTQNSHYWLNSPVGPNRTLFTGKSNSDGSTTNSLKLLLSHSSSQGLNDGSDIKQNSICVSCFLNFLVLFVKRFVKQ